MGSDGWRPWKGFGGEHDHRTDSAAHIIRRGGHSAGIYDMQGDTRVWRQKARPTRNQSEVTQDVLGLYASEKGTAAEEQVCNSA